MQAGIAHYGRTFLAALTAALMVFSLMFVFADTASAEHDPHEDTVANNGPAGTNDAPYWETYLLTERGIEDATCWKISQESSSAWVMPAEPAGEDWVLLVVKQGDTNFVFYDPIAGHSYPSVGDNAPGYSHIIVCSVEEPEDTTTTTVEDTTTTTVEDTTTTTVEDTTTTTTVEDTTTTTIEDEVLGTTVTTQGPTTTTIKDEVLGTEVLPFTGADNGMLGLIAGSLGLLGTLVVMAARRIED